MTSTTVGGLDTILSCINSEADAAAEKIILGAKSEADDIIKTAENKAEEILNAAKSKAEVVKSDARRRESAALQHNEKQKILAAKQDILNRVISDSLAQIKSDNKKYFSLLTSIFMSRVDKKISAEIVMSAEDIKRMPSDFKKLLAGYEGLRLTESADLEPGFKISYGDSGIVDNCTIDALAEAEIDAIKEAVQRVLFA